MGLCARPRAVCVVPRGATPARAAAGRPPPAPPATTPGRRLGPADSRRKMDGMDQQVGGLMHMTNGLILQDGKFVEGDLWVDLDTGKFVPAPPAGAELPDIMGLDCKGLLVAPGFIDIQNNGSFGVDLSLPGLTAADVQKFRVQLLQHGVTSVCPTVVTSDPGTYREVLGLIGGAAGSAEDGVTVLGAHLEGPFIDAEKKGAHKEDFVQAPSDGFQSLLDAYGVDAQTLGENVAIVREVAHSASCSSVASDQR